MTTQGMAVRELFPELMKKAMTVMEPVVCLDDKCHPVQYSSSCNKCVAILKRRSI
jgi:hypothetical protein